MSSLGALRYMDSAGNWSTKGHSVVVVPSPANLPGLAADAEAGQTVWTETPGALWVFDGTVHVKVGSTSIYTLVKAAEQDLQTGFYSVFTFLDDTKVPVGAWGVVGHSIGFDTNAVPNLQWFDINTGANINTAVWTEIPAGTLVQKTATNVVRERHKPGAGGGIIPIDAADEAKAIDIGAFAIATEDLDLAPADFTGWTWITDFTGNIAQTGATIPAGTVVERTGQTEITERSRVAVQNVIESDSVAGDFFVDCDWGRYEEYEVFISTGGGIQFQASTDMDWWGTQVSSLGGISNYSIDGAAATWKQVAPNVTTVLKVAIPRSNSGAWSLDCNPGAVNVPGVGNVQEFIKASGYISGTRPTRFGFKLPSASNSISIIGRSRHA